MTDRRAIYELSGATGTERLVLLAKLDYPEATAAELAALLRTTVRTVRRAYQLGRERGVDIVTPRGDEDVTPPDDIVTPRTISSPPPVDTVTPPASNGQPANEGDYSHTGADAPGVGLAEEAPPPPPSATAEDGRLFPVEERKKGQPLHAGTGLSAEDLRALALRVYEARKAAGRTVSSDYVRLRAPIAAALREGVEDLDLLVEVASTAWKLTADALTVGYNKALDDRSKAAAKAAPRRPWNMLTDERPPPDEDYLPWEDDGGPAGGEPAKPDR